jgi:hypothetical protein
MAKKISRQELEKIVSNFANQATRKNDSYAYTVGYLVSLTASLLSKLPLQEQLHQISILNTSSVWEKNA